MRVSIVTATTGNPLLKKAIESVQAQDYENIEHIIVIDGKEREEAANQVLSSVTFTKPHHILTLPYPTGLDGYVCHRIYGASAYLVNGDYIVFLDDDNWFEPYHISSLVDLVYSKNLDWAYALRNIVNSDGEFITQDNCESLGKDRVFTNYHHVDTNCYFIRKDIAVKVSSTWYKKYRESGLNADMILCDNLLRHFPNCDTNGLYSVNYRTDATEKSVKSSFFLYGNSLVKSQFKNGYPWCKALPNYQEKLQENLQLRDINLITFPDWKIDNSEVLEEELNSIITTILNHPERVNINLLIFISESLREEVEVFLWDLMLNFMEENQLESDLPEITLVSEMSPVRWSYLLPFLSSYIKTDHQDAHVIPQTIQDNLSALTLEEITNNKFNNIENSNTRKFNNINYQSIAPTYNYPKHFVILGHPGCGDVFLNKILNQHPRIFCAGEIFNSNPEHEDVIYAKNIMETKDTLSLFNLPDFFDKCSVKENRQIIGLRCFYPPTNTMSIPKIEVLIESGYKIIFLKRRNLLKAFYSWKKAMKSQTWHLDNQGKSILIKGVNDTQIINDKLSINYLDINEAKQWIESVRNYLTFVKQKLDQRVHGYLDIDYEDMTGNIIDNGKNGISDIFNYLEVDNIDFEAKTKQTASQDFYNQITNRNELETLLDYSFSSDD